MKGCDVTLYLRVMTVIGEPKTDRYTSISPFVTAAVVLKLLGLYAPYKQQSAHT